MDHQLRRNMKPLIIPSPYTGTLPGLTPPITPRSPLIHGNAGSPDPYYEFRSRALHSVPPPPDSPLDASPAHIQQRELLLGEGAWSRVYAVRGRNLAVKTPINAMSREVIGKEAKILHFLSVVLPDTGIAEYHGYDVPSSSLFMQLVPDGTLESFVLAKAQQLEANGTGSLANLRRPVVGMSQWLFLAERLAAVFAALKRVGVVHGDVKWTNILLREFVPSEMECDRVWRDCSETLYEPVVVDFSSAHFILEDDPPEAVNAVTTSFCAPELLESFISRPPSRNDRLTPPATPTSPQCPTPYPLPTFESDLYSVALCLLAAAVGSEVYRNAGRFVGIYVRQGNPIGWVKSDERGLRIGRGSVVASTLEGCFGKTAEGRTTVEVLEERANDWKEKWSLEGRSNPRWGC
jgi:serine/threonine protein kinase